MTTATPEQFVAAYQTNLETLFNLTQTALEGVEKVVKLNLNAAKATLEDSVGTSKALFGVKDPQDLLRSVGKQRLKELGLEALARPEGLVPRYQWEASDGFSLMQELAKEIGYTPHGK